MWKHIRTCLVRGSGSIELVLMHDPDSLVSVVASMLGLVSVVFVFGLVFVAFGIGFLPLWTTFMEN